MYVTACLVTRWLPVGPAVVHPAGPVGGVPGGLQPTESVRRFTCYHLLGGRVSAAGAASTSTGVFSVFLAGGLCTLSVSLWFWRSLFLRWHLEGCRLA